MATTGSPVETVDPPQPHLVSETASSTEIEKESSTPEPAPAYEKIISTSEDTKPAITVIQNVEDSEGSTVVAKEPDVSCTVGTTYSLDDAARESASNLICAFGPATTFFFYTGIKGVAWKYVCDRSTCPEVILASTIQSWSIGTVYDVALSPYGAGYFAYDSLQGGCTWRLIDVKASAKPKKRKDKKEFEAAVTAFTKLKTWLGENLLNAHDIRTTKVRIGRGGRLMAWKSDGKWVHNDLPPALHSEIEQKTKAAGGMTVLPRNMTFGLGDAWGAVWPDKTLSLQLDGKYATLNKYRQTNVIKEVLHVTMDCCNKTEQFYVRSCPAADRYRAARSRIDIISKQWDLGLRMLSKSLDIDVSFLSYRNDDVVSRTFLTAKDASAAIEAGVALDSETKGSEALAHEAAMLSIKSSEKSIKASKIAVAAGVFTIVAGCTVM